MDFHHKYEQLKSILKQYKNVLVAFSGGVDSTFLLYTAHQVLGDQAVAVTAASPSFPQRELAEAQDFCRLLNIRQIIRKTSESEMEIFQSNPPDRCYHCKKELFSGMLTLSGEEELGQVIEGSNMDDLGDYRPGLKAIEELNIKSPLREAGLYKKEIRALSKELGLPVWNKPSFACLASRFVYGEPITPEKLQMVEQAEQQLMNLGLTQFRVRIHGKLARIEIFPDDFPVLMEPAVRSQITEDFRSFGFTYVTLDLDGYRSGSMNETLPDRL